MREGGRRSPLVPLTLHLLGTLALCLAIFVATRALVRALPGDPAETLIAETGTPLSVTLVREDLGLDRPFGPALAQDLRAAVLHGDLGRSLFNRQPVARLVSERLAKSAELAGAAFALGLALSLALGLGAAEHRAGDGSLLPAPLALWADRLCTGLGAVSAALPTPWTGPMLIILLALWLPLFSIGDSVALPALTLALSFGGFWCRLFRSRTVEMLALDAARAARARGVPELRVLWKYGLMPAAGPLAAYLGTQLGFLLAGAFVVEVIFDWRGLGSLLIDSVLRRDYPVVEGAAFAAASVTAIGNLLGDFAQFLLSPRGAGG